MFSLVINLNIFFFLKEMKIFNLNYNLKNISFKGKIKYMIDFDKIN